MQKDEFRRGYELSKIKGRRPRQIPRPLSILQTFILVLSRFILQ
jgi:hypothetical protein